MFVCLYSDSFSRATVTEEKQTMAAEIQLSIAKDTVQVTENSSGLHQRADQHVQPTDMKENRGLIPFHSFVLHMHIN